MFKNFLKLAFNSCSIKRYSTMAEHVKAIYTQSLLSVTPKTLIQNNVQISGNVIQVQGKNHELKEKCYIVGFGKAVLGMAVCLEKLLAECVVRGIVSVPIGIFESLKDNPDMKPAENSKLKFIEGAKNNLPDAPAMMAAQEITDLVSRLNKDDLLFVVVSGGGSALLPSARPPVSLEAKCELIKALGNRGANIFELNSVRKRLSFLKGGGLAALAYPAPVISLIISDVIDDPIDVIGSGPTIANTDSPQRALEIIEKYFMDDEIPSSVRTVLSLRDTDTVPNNLSNVHNYLIGNNKMAVEAAKVKAEEFGYQSIVLSTSVQGDVKVLSTHYAKLVKELIELVNKSENEGFLYDLLNSLKDSLHFTESAFNELLHLDFNRDICLIAAGEPTVTVTGDGKGGRNQHLALQFAIDLEEVVKDINTAEIEVVFLSCGTDGIDGPTDAAGAISYLNLVRDSYKEGFIPEKYLVNSDSYGFYSHFQKGKYLVSTGHSGTNVMDIHVILIRKHQ